MEESLKALRITHRTLLAILAAVLLFALSPNRHDTYQRAYAFLDHLQAIDADAYVSWAQDVADRKLVSRHDFLGALFAEIANRGGPVVDWNHIDDGTISQMLTFSQVGPRIESGSLEILNREFREDVPVQEVFLPVDRLALLILNDLDREPRYRLDNLAISGTPSISRMNVQLYLYDDTGTLHHIYGTVKFSSRPLDGQSFRRWLAETGQAGLISSPDASGIAFAPLRPLWPFIYAKSISEAKDWIQQELVRLGDAKILSVFGVSTTEFQAGIAAPAVTFVLLLAIGAQLRHINRLASRDDLTRVHTFPWLPLFPGSMGAIARTATLLVLPVGANAWLLIRAQGAAAWVGWIEWALVVGAGVWAFLEAKWLAQGSLSSAHRPTGA